FHTYTKPFCFGRCRPDCQSPHSVSHCVPGIGGIPGSELPISKRLWLQAPDFQEGQAQVADGVQEAMQGRLIDDLPDKHGLARLLPAQGEAPEPVSPLRSQLTLDANTVAGWGRQHGRAPLT